MNEKQLENQEIDTVKEVVMEALTSSQMHKPENTDRQVIIALIRACHDVIESREPEEQEEVRSLFLNLLRAEATAGPRPEEAETEDSTIFMTPNDVIPAIERWAMDRNLIEGATPQAQMVKLVEEMGELAGGIARGKRDLIIDGIGDCVVVLTILAAQHGMKIDDCMYAAYQEIKDRKGRMINGVFVKEADLPQEQKAA